MSLPPRPAVPPLATFVLPPRRMETLPGGARATLIDVGTVPLAAIRLVLGSGSVDLPPDATWLDRFVFDYLREGTEQRDAAAFAAALAAMGGRLEIDSDEQTTTLQTEVLSEHTPAAVALLVELARTPRFPEDAAERLLTDLHRSLDMATAQPSWLAHTAMRKALFGDQPYGRVMPTSEMLDSFTTARAAEFWARTTGARRAHLLLAGRFAADAVLEAAQRSMDGWAPGPEAAPLVVTTRAERAIHLVDRPGSEQSTFQLGLPVIDPGHKDYVALEVTNALLGGAFASRITMNIREDKGYTYSPRSVISTRPQGTYWAEVADVTTAVTGASLREIFGEIDRLRGEAPPEEELTGVRNYVAGSFVIRQSSPAALLDHLEFLDRHGLDASYSASYLERVQAVTPAEVQRLTVEHLRPEAMAVAMVADRAVVEPQVAEFGPILA
ncbi:MAG: pitrilysin family protein [Dehalococcoidia bacterium]|nr:pitrilysin family protein [Dehalococcoidia bacterium]